MRLLALPMLAPLAGSLVAAPEACETAMLSDVDPVMLAEFAAPLRPYEGIRGMQPDFVVFDECAPCPTKPHMHFDRSGWIAERIPTRP